LKSVPLPFFSFLRKSGADGRQACGSRASLALRSVFSTLQRLAPLQSHNSRLGALRQMTLRALRCDGRVPRKSRYSRSGKPLLPTNVRGGATGGSQRSNQKTFPDQWLIGFIRRRAETFSRQREPPWQPPRLNAKSKKIGERISNPLLFAFSRVHALGVQ